MLLLAIVAFGIPLALNLSARVNAEVRTQARAQADLVAATAADLLGTADRSELQVLAQSGAASIRGRILVVDRHGIVLADSAGPGEIGTSYLSRPEIQAALDRRQVQLQRSSRTLGTQILATAAPIIRDDAVAGAVRVTQSVAAVQTAVGHAELGLALIAVIVLALGLGAGLVIARQTAGPVQRLERVARRVAQGEVGARAELEGSREQRSLAVSFNEMTARIARLLDAQREFVADASHQLRTPLTALRLRLEEARATLGAPEADRELAAAIAEVDRMSDTVQELLVLSRAGQRRVEGAHVDLDQLAVSMVARWRAPAREAGIALEHRREGDSATAWAARHDLERILDVLIENALRYSPAGTVVVVAAAPGRIEVRDAGPGVDESERELVFERFHRGRVGRGGPGGSGLGLAIARELARAWDGDVTIAPEPPPGATFVLSIPAEPEPGGADGDSGPEAPPTLPALDLPRRSVHRT
ncbi:MAG: ATP-binding protein [Solirubrobacteraceae bacterium]